ncbi:hypothetical protein [Chitinophaga rhizophila]|uniref:Uncharacterized protein n=1 Tax=Chitinophaga rhizophila TaxID=2866212 RepID=A0ABS7GAH3_9BACT|nr:hypothetical protein [Chitinophaga rhizophila]MBW8684668.1 hypothetical protein [Chitinophaga rhizophila]
MKIVSSLYRTLLFVAIISQTACKKDTLPAETAEGRNVVACYVDGKLVRNRAPFGNTTPLYDCFYQHKYNTENGYYFHLSAKDKRQVLSGSMPCTKTVNASG